MGTLVLLFAGIGQAMGASTTLSWDASPDQSSGLVRGYTIWYGNVGGGATNNVSVGLTNKATVSGLTAGQPYFFYATAYDAGQAHSVRTAILTNTPTAASPLNTAPQMPAISNRTVDEGGTLQFTITATDVETPTQNLRFSLANAPAGATVNATTGAFSWTPTSAQVGNTYSITATVSDGGSPAMSASRVFSVQVRAGVYLTLNSSPDGSVQLNPVGPQTASGYRYAPGTTVQLTARPNSGKTLHHWVIAGQSKTGNPVELAMLANTAVTPVFTNAVAQSTDLIVKTSYLMPMLTLQWNSTPGKTYRIFTAADADSNNWAPLSDVNAGVGSTTTYLALVLSGVQDRYYRVQEV